jgi:hypothetical protein
MDIGRDLSKHDLGIAVDEARRSALTAVAEFRRTHLDIVMAFLLPDGQRLASRGTGGTEFSVWLQNLISETENATRP